MTTTNPATDTAKIARLRRAYERALAKEVKLVDALTDRSTRRQLDAAEAAAEATNAALRALQAAYAAEAA